MVSGIILRNVGTLIPECWYRSNRISGILMPEQRYKTARNTHFIFNFLYILYKSICHFLCILSALVLAIQNSQNNPQACQYQIQK